MIAPGPARRKLSFLDLEALPPDLRDFALSRHPSRAEETAGAGYARSRPGLAPEAALRVHPCRALSSAPVRSSVDHTPLSTKFVIVADREK